MPTLRHQHAQELASEALIDLFELNLSKYGGGVRYWTSGPVGEAGLNLIWNATPSANTAGWSAPLASVLTPANTEMSGAYLYPPGNGLLRYAGGIPASTSRFMYWTETYPISPGMWAHAHLMVLNHRCRVRLTVEFLGEASAVVGSVSSTWFVVGGAASGQDASHLRFYRHHFAEGQAPAGTTLARFVLEVRPATEGNSASNPYIWFTNGFFAVLPQAIGRPLEFTPGAKVGAVRFGGVTYEPIPVRLQGLERSGRGPVPRINVVVPDVAGLATALLATYRNMLGCTITRRQVFRSALDDGVNADPTDFYGPETFYIDRIARHVPGTEVVLECASPLDIQGTLLPPRQMVRDFCDHTYRSWTGGNFLLGSCPYVGAQYFRADNSPTPSPAEDQCSKRLTGCRARFGQHAALPFRGFPGMGRSRI